MLRIGNKILNKDKIVEIYKGDWEGECYIGVVIEHIQQPLEIYFNSEEERDKAFINITA